MPQTLCASFLLLIHCEIELDPLPPRCPRRCRLETVTALGRDRWASPSGAGCGGGGTCQGSSCSAPWALSHPRRAPSTLPAAVSGRPHGDAEGARRLRALGPKRQCSPACPLRIRPRWGSSGAWRRRVGPWPPCGHSVTSPHQRCVRSPAAPTPAVPKRRGQGQPSPPRAV